MRRQVIAISIAAVLAGCGPLADLASGEGDAPDEAVPEEASPAGEAAEPGDTTEDEAPPAGEAAEPDGPAEEGSDAQPGDGAWDPAVRTNFLDACLGSSGDAAGYCECALDSFTERFTQAEFETIEQEMMASDATPPEFDEVVESCLEQHG